MFAYQAAAFLRSRGLASIISFGSPVDVHKNLPALRGELTGALAELVEPAVGRLVERLVRRHVPVK
jgi:putative long chain acyl-CoA synthase